MKKMCMPLFILCLVVANFNAPLAWAHDKIFITKKEKISPPKKETVSLAALDSEPITTYSTNENVQSNLKHEYQYVNKKASSPPKKIISLNEALLKVTIITTILTVFRIFVPPVKFS